MGNSRIPVELVETALEMFELYPANSIYEICEGYMDIAESMKYKPIEITAAFASAMADFMMSQMDNIITIDEDDEEESTPW